MSRSERLLQLMQILRRYRYPVTGAELASELGISLRSVYRDIASLQQQGARIEGSAGLGFILKPGYQIPPLMFNEEEIAALVLGSRWVIQRGDSELIKAARDALAKIAAVLPEASRLELEHNGLLIGPGHALPANDEIVQSVRRAIRREQKLKIRYADAQQQQSQRIVWPCALGYFDHALVLVAWCESRQDFRHFRIDRVQAAELATEKSGVPRLTLLQRWRQQMGILSTSTGLP